MKVGLCTLAVVGALCIAPIASEAQQAGESPLVTISTHGGSLSFQPTAGQALTLTVTGESFRSSNRFGVGQAPIFAPVDAKGFSLPDGLYFWELVEGGQLVSASGRTKGKLANGRSVHKVAGAEGTTQSGSFSVLNGKFVDASLVEPATPRAPSAKGPTSAAAGEIDDSDAAASDYR